MHLREADEGDAAAVAALWTEAYADAGPEGRQEPYALSLVQRLASVLCGLR